MTHRSKSTLFLIEQLIVIAVFALCAAACISIFTAAYFYTNDSKATSNAVLKAESAAEIFKASGGDHLMVANFMGGPFGSGDAASVKIYFNNEWLPCDISIASYLMDIAVDPATQAGSGFSPVTGNLTVGKITGEQLVSIPLSARISDGGEAQ